MSSTNRGGDRHASDYYVTPVSAISEFLLVFDKAIPGAVSGRILDPCAGGDDTREMSYPAALYSFGIQRGEITTVDIRADSKAEICQDYLVWQPERPFDLIITNPPFAIAEEVIRKALTECRPAGWVVMLLRLNFFEGMKRRAFWRQHMPMYVFIHSKRMCFTGDGKTDSVAYMHACWRASYRPEYAHVKVI